MKTLETELEEIMCACSGTTKAKIITLIEEGRAKTVDEVSRITGACSGCGGCDYEVEQLIASHV